MSLDADLEFPSIGGVVCVRVDGYFTSDTKTKIPFPTSGDTIYYVEHVDNPASLGAGLARTYYRKVSSSDASVEFHAILTGTNVVKKVKVAKVKVPK